MKSCFLALPLALAVGCTSELKVYKLEGDGTRGAKMPGVPYYLPKPYLLVTRGTHEDPKKGMVTKAEIVYLPDLENGYAVTMSKTSGNATLGIKLGDGWRLEGLDLESDAQVDEAITSLAKVLEAVPVAALAVPQPVELWEFGFTGGKTTLTKVYPPE